MEFDESFSLQVHGKVCKYSVVFIIISFSLPSPLPPFRSSDRDSEKREGRFQFYVQSSFLPQLDKWLDSSYLFYPFIYLYISIFVI